MIVKEYSSLSDHFAQIVRTLLINRDIVGFPLARPKTIPPCDFFARVGDETWVIDTKFYTTPRTRLHLVEVAAAKLLEVAIRTKATKALLVVSCTLSEQVRKTIEDKYSLTLTDRTELLRWAFENPVIFRELKALLEDTKDADTADGFRQIEHRYTIPVTFPLPVRPTLGNELSNELQSLKAGRKDWPAYEKLCERIMNYLFSSELTGWRTQMSTNDGSNRPDCVCRIKPISEFWRFLVEQLHSRYLVFEFKNSAKEILPKEVLTTEKYLFEKGLRRATIIVTRVGASRRAKDAINGIMREHGKLILVLDDNLVCKMLSMNEQGKDPSDLLFDMTDQFLLSLPR